MIRAKYMLCAEQVVQDATETLSAIHILEVLSSPGFPTVLPMMVVLVLLERDLDDPEQIECRLRLNMGKTEIFNHPVTNDFSGKCRVASIISVGDLHIHHAGLLQASYSIDGKELAQFEITVE